MYYATIIAGDWAGRLWYDWGLGDSDAENTGRVTFRYIVLKYLTQGIMRTIGNNTYRLSTLGGAVAAGG